MPSLAETTLRSQHVTQNSRTHKSNITPVPWHHLNKNKPFRLRLVILTPPAWWHLSTKTTLHLPAFRLPRHPASQGTRSHRLLNPCRGGTLPALAPETTQVLVVQWGRLDCWEFDVDFMSKILILILFSCPIHTLHVIDFDFDCLGGDCIRPPVAKNHNGSHESARTS